MSLINNSNIFMVKLVILGFFLRYTCLAKEYKRCEVTNLLKENGFDRSLLPAWMCLINAESGRQTDKVTTHGFHKNYGLFQIQSMEYCTPGKKNGGGLCKSDCNDFINDNMSDDMTCAKKIQALHGFKVWSKYETSCKGENLQLWIDDVNKCLNAVNLIQTKFNNEGAEPYDEMNEIDQIHSTVYHDKSDRSSANVETKVSLVLLLSLLILILKEV